MKKIITVIALFAVCLSLVSAQEYGVNWTRKAYHITTGTTNTPTTGASTALMTLVFNVTGTPTSEVITVQDKSTTPKILYQTAALNAATTAPVVVAFPVGILASGGIDIVTSGTVGTGVVDLWITYR